MKECLLTDYIKNSLQRRSFAAGGDADARVIVHFFHHKEIITQQYPEVKQVLPERFRGEVIMTHNENNEHRCTGCTACELACPNGTIKIITKFDVTADGKKKKALDLLFVYHLELLH